MGILWNVKICYYHFFILQIIFFNPLVFILCFLVYLLCFFITFCQIDFKKLIAYSSVAHMGYVTIWLFTYNFQGLQGSIFLMLSHGIVSSFLFFLIGMLYDRYKTRIIFFTNQYIAICHFSLYFFFCHISQYWISRNYKFCGRVSY